MLIPLHDGLPLRRIPFQLVTTALIVLCVLVQLHTAAMGEAEAIRFAYAFGAIPAVILGQADLARYLLMHPKQKIWALLFGKIPVRFRAYWLLGAWIAMQVFFALVGDDSNTAWFAHLGGLVAGALLTPLFRRRDMPLFDQANVAPPAPEVLAAIRQRHRIPRAGGSPWTRRRPD